MPLPDRPPLKALQVNTTLRVQNRKHTRKSLASPPVSRPGHISRERQNIQLQDFEIGKILGKGKLGKVYCAKHIESGYICALKVMSKLDLWKNNLQNNLKREVEIQRDLDHPYISKLFNYFHDDANVYIALEFSPCGELYHELKLLRRFNDVTASYYISQVASALKYLHLRGIIHRDIKPENILLAADKTVRLSDFGWSISPAFSSESRRRTLCGTLDYLPPEMVEAKDHDITADLWLLGILSYELLVGRPPFEEDDRNATYKRIARVDLQFPHYVSADAADFISRLLKKDTKERLLLVEVELHPWIVRNSSRWHERMSAS